MPDIKAAESAQKFIEIKEVRNGTLILKGGGLRKILMVTGTNFEMKSEEEQTIILNTFQAFLNSLSFNLQIFIHSRKLNIDAYLESLNERLGTETNELLKNQITEYREFIRSFVEQNTIMTKSYFVAVPFDSVQLPGGVEGGAGKIFGLFKKKTVGEGEGKSAAEQTLEEKFQQLDQRVSQVTAELNQIGLRAVPLNDEEIIELFYNLYNPESVEKASLNIAKPENIKENQAS